MRLKLQNVGIIQSADIRIDGLTVIAGNNDVGKSFIGKALYLAVKSPEISKKVLANNIQEKVEKYFESFWQSCMTYIMNEKVPSNEPVPSDLFNWQNLSNFIAKEILVYVGTPNFKDKINEDLLSFKSSLEDSTLKNLTNETQLKISELFEELERNIIKAFEDGHSMKNIENVSVDWLIDKVFENQISSKNPNRFESILSINGFSTVISNNKSIKTTISGNKTFSNATYIESPAIYLVAPIIKNQLAFGSRNVRQSGSFIEYNIDLTEKIIGAKYEVNTEQKRIIENINKIIGGSINFQEFSGDFTFKKNDGLTFTQNNTASGIKWFGLLQSLLASGNIQKNSVIIIDEPETHLHPKWQVEYAKIIVEMVKNGIYIVLSSHSPYMIEALKRISDKEISDKTSFYLGEYNESEKCSTFIDVTEGISPIFKTLSSPMNELYLDI